MKGNRGYAGMSPADPHPYPVRGCVILHKPLTQRARGFEGHDWKIVGLFLHILNRPQNPLVPNNLLSDKYVAIANIAGYDA